MTRKVNRSYSLSVLAPFFAILVVLVAQSAWAQTAVPDQTPGEPHDVFGMKAVTSSEHESMILRHGQRFAVDLQDSNPPIFAPAVTYGSGGYYPHGLAVADLNNDGKPDLVIANCAPIGAADCDDFEGVVGVLLGNGDGTFQKPKEFKSGGDFANSVAVGDVNGDGKPDLVVSNGDSNTVGVLLGTGNGTFRPAVTYDAGGSSASVAVADLNSDGKLDIVVANSGNVGVLLGNGNGTFQPVVTYNWGGGGPWSALAVTDLTGNHILDLVVTNSIGSDVGVLLGNGDGTFQPVVTYDSGGSYPLSVAVAEVNGDGIPDLVLTNAFSNTVGVLLGNGDGTFQPVVTFDAGGSYPFQVAVADVNGDGIPDLVVTYYLGVIGHTVGVLLGNGDGTCQAAVSYDSGNYAASTVVVADVNGDGRPDLVVGGAENSKEGSVGVLLNNTGSRSPTTATLASSLNPSVFGQAVTFTAVVSSSVGAPTGTMMFFDGSNWLGNATTVNGSASLSVASLGAGTQAMAAKYEGSFDFSGSTSNTVSQVVTMATTTISLASSHNPATVNEAVTYTATVASQNGGAVTGKVVFQDGGATIGTAALSGNRSAYKTKYVAAGVHSTSVNLLR